jgi:hypothetical protein
MCDYSLDAIASRPAKTGDWLVTTSFVGTFTRGFSAANERGVAVCLRSGTELAFDEDVDWDMPFKVFRPKRPLSRLVRFRQVSLSKRHAHHDAIEFPNGTIVLITRLCEGQKATVLQLPAARTDHFVRETEPGKGTNLAVISLVAARKDPSPARA